jgi:G protein-coupled receptor GPR1
MPVQPGFNSVYTSVEPHDLYRTYQVRLATLVCSGVSVTASIIAFYWFCRMDKLFRHR